MSPIQSQESKVEQSYLAVGLAEYPKEFYSFAEYVTKHRMLTFWYQIREVLALQPSSVLEIGVGTGLVAGYLRHLGIRVTTVDINPSLKPDCVGSVLDLQELFAPSEFDVTLCARVLHHLPFSDFEPSLRQIIHVTQRHAVLTLPIEDLRLYMMVRYTGTRVCTASLRLPLRAKPLLLWLLRKQRFGRRTSSFWKINSSHETRLLSVATIASKICEVEKQFRIPEDAAHFMMVLRKRSL